LRNLTHKELINLVAVKLTNIHYEIVISEGRTTQDHALLEVPDVYGDKDDGTVMVECKVSVTDFKADLKKPFRITPELGVGNYRYYCCPKGLIQPHEVPKNWGLMYASKMGVSIVKDPKYQVANIHAEKQLLKLVIRGMISRGVVEVAYTYKQQTPERLVMYNPIEWHDNAKRCETCNSPKDIVICSCEAGYRGREVCSICEGRGWTFRCKKCEK